MSRPVVLIPAYNPNQPSAAKVRQGTMGKVPTGLGISQKRPSTGERRRPSHPNKKPNFTAPPAIKKVNLNAARPRKQAYIDLTATKKTDPAFKNMVGITATKKADILTNNTANLSAASPRKRAYIDLTAPKIVDPSFKKMVDTIANKKAGGVANKKVNPNPAVPRKQAYVDPTFQDLAGITANRRGEVTDKSVEVITRMAEVIPDQKSKPIPNNKVNTNGLSTMNAKIQRIPTRHVTFEVAETEDEITSDSGESGSESEDDAETNGNLFMNVKHKVQCLRIPVANNEDIEAEDEEDSSSSESESESESDSEAMPTKKLKLEHVFAPHPRIEELNTSSESGSDIEVASANKANVSTISKANVQCNTRKSIGQKVEVDSSSSGSGSDSGDVEDESDEEGSQMDFGDEVSSSHESNPLEPLLPPSAIPEKFLPNPASTSVAQISPEPVKCASGFGPNSNVNVRQNFEVVEPNTPTTPVGNVHSFQQVHATQPTSTTYNDQSFQNIYSNQPSTPTGNVSFQGLNVNQPATQSDNIESSETIEVDQVATPFQKSNPIDPSAIPRWFPRKVKGILKVPSCPDALTYKSIHRLNHYRNWLGQLHFHRWERYSEAGNNRYQLTKLLITYKFKRLSMSSSELEYRIRQRNWWKGEGLRTMKNLDKITKGLKFLDDILEIIFGHERNIYKERLERKKGQQVVQVNRKPCVSCD